MKRLFWIKRKSSLAFLIVIVLTTSVAVAKSEVAPQGTPIRAIQDLDDMLSDFKTGKQLGEADKEHNRQLKRKIINGTFDIRELTRLAMGKHWDIRSKSDQDYLVNLMIQVIEEKALLSKEHSSQKSKKREGGKYRISYTSERYLNEKKNRAYVKTSVFVPTEKMTINLNYRLRKKGSEWKVYDIIVDDASLVENYRYQFNSIITKHGYPELVKRIEKKLEEIQKERKQG